MTKFYNKNSSLTEYQIQRTVKQWLDTQKVLYFSVPNEAACNSIKGRHLKETGMRKGVSDMFIAEPHHSFHGMFLELKNSKGMLSPEQRQFLREVEQKHYFTAVCFSIDEAINILSWYISKPFESKH